MSAAPYIELTPSRIALAAGLVVAGEALGLALRLGIRGRLVVAAARSAIQLVLVGFVLRWVFATASPALTIALVVPMTAIAGIAAVRRTPRRYAGIWGASIVSVAASGWSIAAFAVLLVVQPEPWWAPQYSIPLAGIILGNTLTGISLGLDRFGEDLAAKRGQIEMLLSLGATRWEAARPFVREAVRAGMIPTMNAMLVAGIVSLPGTMTGQLLAGVEPIAAAEYQIVIMFLLAAGTQIGTISVVLLTFRVLFNTDHQFLRDRLVRVAADRKDIA
jgi:putative ABC transport system permease protein